MSVLEFLRSRSEDVRKGRGCGSDMDGTRKLPPVLERVRGSADCCLPMANGLRSPAPPNIEGLCAIGDLEGVMGSSTAVSRRS